jgi:transposase
VPQRRSQKRSSAQIVFDPLHIVAAFGRVIDQIRDSEHRKAAAAGKAVFKGSKYLLQKNRANTRGRKGRQQLKKRLSLYARADF